MSDYVLSRRFVNTPTVMELWDVEHAKEPKEHEPKDVEELVEEKDDKAEVTGTESYYRWAMAATNYVEGERAGNEGLWTNVKSAFTTFIENVKKFFKWVFSFFTSKKRMVEQTTDKLEKTVKAKGVKEGPIAYPKDYVLIWNAEGKPGQDITWIKGKLTEIEGVINGLGKGYLKELESYLSELRVAIKASTAGQISNNRAGFDKVQNIFTTNLEKIIKTGPFLAGTTLEVGKNGKLLTKPNTKIGKGAKGVTFKTTVSTVDSVLSAVNHTNDLYGDFTSKVTRLENVFVAQMEAVIGFAGQFEARDPAGAKEITDRVKQTISVAMSNLKMLETILYKAINAGLSVANAAVKQEGKAKTPEDAK